MTATRNNTLIQDKWGLHSLRFGYFNKTVGEIGGEELFENFFGFSADAVTKRKADFLSEFTTQKGHVTYQTIIAGLKVDFLVNIGFSDDHAEGIPTLPSEENFEDFFKTSAKALITKDKNKINRIAIGVHYMIPASSHSDGYSKLQKILPSIDLSGDCRDFQFRINRPRTELPISINRVSTWGCLVLKMGITTDGQNLIKELGQAVSLKTDINTVSESDFSTLTEEEKISTLEKLFDYSKEISLEGMKL